MRTVNGLRSMQQIHKRQLEKRLNLIARPVIAKSCRGHGITGQRCLADRLHVISHHG